eukprot:1138278-Pelagomonas_calceolata.AAC.3
MRGHAALPANSPGDQGLPAPQVSTHPIPPLPNKDTACKDMRPCGPAHLAIRAFLPPTARDTGPLMICAQKKIRH